MKMIVLLAALPAVAIVAALLAIRSSQPLVIVAVGLATYYAGLATLIWRRRAHLRTLSGLLLSRLLSRTGLRRSAETEDSGESRYDRDKSLTLAEIRASTSLSRSDYGLQLLADRATWGRNSLEELRRIAVLEEEHSGDPETPLIWPALSAHDAVALAHMLVSLRQADEDLVLAIALLERIAAQGDAGRLSDHDLLLLPALLIERGDRGRAIALMSSSANHELVVDQMRADLLNPFLTPHGEGDTAVRLERWLLVANGVIARQGLEPIAIRDSPDDTAFDRLTSEARSVTTLDRDDPLVTIVMTSYKPGREAVSAVRSVLAQSWTRWELLVVDDASGDDATEILAEIESMDPRITVHRRTTNAGTYACRNVALDIAQGDLVTVLDADDWMHPRRLEYQVRDLQNNPAQLANVTNTLRVTQDLGFLHDRGPGIKLCEPAMMYRRRELVERVGYYHEARKGADSELRWRIGVVQGFPVTHLTSVPPLTLQRFDTGSLSGGDFVRGWIHPARVAYRSAWWEWHRQHRRNPGALRLDRGAHVPFPVPPHMSGQPRQNHELDLDVVLILDASDRPSLYDRQQKALSLASKISSSGGRVGLLHVWTIAEIPGGHLVQSPSLQAMINRGSIVQVFEGDRVTTRLALALSEAETLTGGVPTAWQPVEFAVLANDRQRPRERSTGDARRMTVADVLGEVGRQGA